MVALFNCTAWKSDAVPSSSYDLNQGALFASHRSILQFQLPQPTESAWHVVLLRMTAREQGDSIRVQPRKTEGDESSIPLDSSFSHPRSLIVFSSMLQCWYFPRHILPLIKKSRSLTFSVMYSCCCWILFLVKEFAIFLAHVSCKAMCVSQWSP